MRKGDKYRFIIIISFILLILCSAILLIYIWNKLGMDPGLNLGGGIYFLVYAILIFASIMFILHLLEERQILFPHEAEEEIKDKKESTMAESPQETYKAPFEVDIDVIAEDIVPRLDSKESVEDFAERILLNMASFFEIVQGIIYLKQKKSKDFKAVATYAYTSENDPPAFQQGEGITGQVAKNKTMLNISSIPEGYLQVQSGLGVASPNNLVIIPLLLNKETIGIIELASFRPLDKETEWTYKNLAKIIGNVFVTKLKSAEKK